MAWRIISTGVRSSHSINRHPESSTSFLKSNTVSEIESLGIFVNTCFLAKPLSKWKTLCDCSDFVLPSWIWDQILRIGVRAHSSDTMHGPLQRILRVNSTFLNVEDVLLFIAEMFYFLFMVTIFAPYCEGFCPSFYGMIGLACWRVEQSKFHAHHVSKLSHRNPAHQQRLVSSVLHILNLAFLSDDGCLMTYLVSAALALVQTTDRLFPENVPTLQKECRRFQNTLPYHVLECWHF